MPTNDYYIRNKDILLAKNQKWKFDNPEKWLYNSVRQRAKKEGIYFDLKVEDIAIPDICPILEVPLVFHTRYSPSIDRIDNSLGYMKNNIWVISVQANRMKNDASLSELALFCQNMMKTRADLNDLYKKEE